MTILTSCVKIETTKAILGFHEADDECGPRHLEESLLLARNVAFLGRDVGDLSPTVHKDGTIS